MRGQLLLGLCVWIAPATSVLAHPLPRFEPKQVREDAVTLRRLDEQIELDVQLIQVCQREAASLDDLRRRALPDDLSTKRWLPRLDAMMRLNDASLADAARSLQDDIRRRAEIVARRAAQR